MKLQTQFHGITLKADYNRTRPTFTSPAYGSQAPPSNDQFLAAVQSLTGLNWDQFSPVGTSTTAKKLVYTYLRLIDLHLIAGVTDEGTNTLQLDQVVIHGEAFRQLSPDAAAILAAADKLRFYPQRIDANFDLSADFLPFSTLNTQFLNDHLTSTSCYHSWTSSEASAAKTWYVGKAQRNGYRVAFYEAAKIHPELPEGAWRVELQMFGNAAQEFCTIYLSQPSADTLTAYMLAQLKKRVSFRTKTADSNKARWPICAWWFQIVAGAGNFSEHKPVTRSISEEKRQRKLIERMKADLDRLGPVYWELASSFAATYQT